MIIIIFFPPISTIQDNLNRKIGKWENRKMGIGECSMIFAKIVSEMFGNVAKIL